jgi:hypothetical protein
MKPYVLLPQMPMFPWISLPVHVIQNERFFLVPVNKCWLSWQSHWSISVQKYTVVSKPAGYRLAHAKNILRSKFLSKSVPRQDLNDTVNAKGCMVAPNSRRMRWISVGFSINDSIIIMVHKYNKWCRGGEMFSEAPLQPIPCRFGNVVPKFSIFAPTSLELRLWYRLVTWRVIFWRICSIVLGKVQ